MSGGRFDFMQYRLRDIAIEIEKIIKENNIKDEWGQSNNYSEKTLNEFHSAILLFKQAEIYMQRIDWLLSGDDTEDCFHDRLKDELSQLNPV